MGVVCTPKIVGISGESVVKQFFIFLRGLGVYNFVLHPRLQFTNFN